MKNKIINKKENKLNLLEEAEARLRVIYWFFAYPNKEVSLNDLSKVTNISKTSANRIVTELVKEDFLKKEVLGKLWRISCNIQHPYNITKKVPYHLSSIYDSGIIEEIHKTIPNAKAIILFGSYRKGDDTEQSDIDIAVEVLGNEEMKSYQLGVIEQIGYRINVPLNLHVFSRNKIDRNLFVSVANGIILEGLLEVVP